MSNLNLDFRGITISWFGNNIDTAMLRSEMKGFDKCRPFQQAVNGLEVIILSHFKAGLDVTSAAYVRGIKESFEALCLSFKYDPEDEFFNKPRIDPDWDSKSNLTYRVDLPDGARSELIALGIVVCKLIKSAPDSHTEPLSDSVDTFCTPENYSRTTRANQLRDGAYVILRAHYDGVLNFNHLVQQIAYEDDLQTEAMERFRDMFGFGEDGLYYFGKSSGCDNLVNARRLVADNFLAEYDFGVIFWVKDDSAWNHDGDHWSMPVFLENPLGGDSIKKNLNVIFDVEGTEVVSSSFVEADY